MKTELEQVMADYQDLARVHDEICNKLEAKIKSLKKELELRRKANK